MAPLDPQKQIRILFGVEPQVKRRTKWKAAELSQEIQDFWLNKGISPFKSGAVLQTIEHIQRGTIEIRALDLLHAKLYITDKNATLGSSNFSFSGFSIQHEVNIRLEKGKNLVNTIQFDGIRAIGEYYWERAMSFSDQLIALLKELLIIVDWQEALARAIADLLEGKYVKEYLRNFELTGTLALWPSQSAGIYQGLQILQQMGSLLVADPTGSGKTKMVSTIQLAMLNWLWEIGRGGPKTNTVVVAPPLVLESWKKEYLMLQRTLPEPISQGILSAPHSFKNKLAKDTLKITNVLIMDEAHNYLNQGSNRSSALASHGAEFIILSTATPINKRAEDLLRLIQLLDPDNLPDQELKEFKVLYRTPVRSLEENQDASEKLRSYIWKFTIRRTKTDLNRLIAKEPDQYHNRLGNPCRYPTQKFAFYKTGETDQDIAIAEAIEMLTADLKGLVYLRVINFPRGRDLSTLEKQQVYIQGRLNAARALSRYRVQASLRSSRVAAIELIEGTAAALGFVGLPPTSKSGGDVLKAIAAMEEQLPQYSERWLELPKWLTDQQQYEEACRQEIKIYKEIAALVRQMSDNREQKKAAQLVAYVKKHSLVVAFDHTVITLLYLHNLIGERGGSSHVISGSNKDSKKSLLEQFQLGSTAKNMVLLCSDAVSEGVNLQAARAVVILDMPSVLRLAEQRIGRIDRLDSPYPSVFIYFPDDSKAFQLRSDRNLIRTAHLTKQLMGANLNLPEELMTRYEDLAQMSAFEVVGELKESRLEQERAWEGIKDAFGDVHRLIEGSNALLTTEEYTRMIHSNATVKCKISFVAARRSWAFIALRSEAAQPGCWLWLTEEDQVYTDFPSICRQLRENLVNTEKVPFSQPDLDYFIKLFRKKQRETLPHKKRRALQVAESLLKWQLKAVQKGTDFETAGIVEEVLPLFQSPSEEVMVDLYGFAMLWLDILIPRLQAIRSQMQKRNFLSLEDLLKPKYRSHFTKQQLNHILQHVSVHQSIELRIAACIVGVKRV